MTQQQAESVKDLAKPVVEALGVITKRKCPICNGTGKVGWKWSPQPGQWFVDHAGRVRLIDNIEPRSDAVDFYDSKLHDVISIETCLITPILEWEEIERVLEGVGYECIVKEHGKYGYRAEIWPEILDIKKTISKQVWCGIGKSRQEAVMKSVIALGKKLGEEMKYV